MLKMHLFMASKSKKGDIFYHWNSLPIPCPAKALTTPTLRLVASLMMSEAMWVKGTLGPHAATPACKHSRAAVTKWRPSLSKFCPTLKVRALPP